MSGVMTCNSLVSGTTSRTECALSDSSVALVFQLTAVDNRYISDQFGTISKEA